MHERRTAYSNRQVFTLTPSIHALEPGRKPRLLLLPPRMVDAACGMSGPTGIVGGVQFDLGDSRSTQMLAWFKRWRRKRYLREALVSDSDFTKAVGRTPACTSLGNDAQARLRELVTLFLHEKVFEAVGHAEIALQDRLLIAVNACLPILNLGIDAYDEWTTVIVYPDEFIVGYEKEDETGVVHSGRELRTGEAWERGPLVISLRDVHAQTTWEGYNVVIHECAHKLDMRNGAPNGFPRLHRGMSARRWSEVFTQAYEDLRRGIERNEGTPIDDYAAESPAECFAVFSEYFFEAPHRLRDAYPGVYGQLVQFYRQDPLATSLGSDSIDLHSINRV